jgi:hypothetical protein
MGNAIERFAICHLSAVTFRYSKSDSVSVSNLTGGNRENGERRPALFSLFSLFPPVEALRKTKLRQDPNPSRLASHVAI